MREITNFSLMYLTRTPPVVGMFRSRTKEQTVSRLFSVCPQCLADFSLGPLFGNSSLQLSTSSDAFRS